MTVRRKQGLGRGLDTLLGEDPVVAIPSGHADSVVEIELSRLKPGRYQPRTKWENEKLDELAASIREQGVISPIVVRPTDGGMFEIVAGERRFRASGRAGRKTIPAIVRTLEDKDALAMALIENMQRSDLNAMEEAQGVRRLIDEFGYTHEQAAKAIGKSRPATTNLLRLLNLADPVQRMLLDGEIEMGHARALLGLAAADQLELANKIVKSALSVRQAEKLVADQKNPPKAPAKRRKKDRDTVNFEERLSDAIGAPVKIEYGRGHAGRLVISFSDLDDLDAIAERICGEE
ncbi:MAG TPA: chromosome partitioning protein ParB [Sutterella sp.]|jgi:ParB family chromosome partitioning protein|nr:chromosome partitioning protein ParB [Sutterella sp.]